MIVVSIIIPYFKKKKYFLKSFFSAYNQSFKNKEIIIIYDDEDKDELDFVKKSIHRFKNIKLIINKKNLGVGISRNKGIKLSKGKYIAFLDSDDIWHKNKLRKQINFMKNKNVGISHTTYEKIDENGVKIGKYIAKKKLSYQQLLNSCDIGLSTVIIKKRILKKYKFPSISTKEDYVLWLKISKKYEIFGINQTLCKWRKTKDSLSSDISKKFYNAFKVYYHYQNFGLINSIYRVFILSFFYIRKNILKTDNKIKF